MAGAYEHRPPYPGAVFDRLDELAQPGPVLEIGAGSGDVTVELASRFGRVDAVEPSTAMLAIGKGRVGGNVRWFHTTVEDAALEGPYGLAVAAESIHWTSWETTFPAIARVLAPGAVLALIWRVEEPVAWATALGSLIDRYSTNREFRKVDLVEELQERRLFAVRGSWESPRQLHRQTVESYIESFHSRNGFSRDRMTGADASAFDEGVRSLVQPHLRDGLVPLSVSARLTWGVPMP